MKEFIIDEPQLIKQCIDGDHRSQEFLFNQFYSDLYLIAMRYLSNHQDAEDAIVQSFVKVFKNLKKFNHTGQGSLGRWIRTILINESIRMLKRRNLIHFNEDIQTLEIQNMDANGLEQLQASDITQMIEMLPTGYRTVFNLYVIEGHSHKEIAQLLQISENTSKTQLKKARHHLMKNISNENAYGNV